MSQSGNRSVEVILPDENGDALEARFAELNTRILSQEERIATIANEAREWTTEQIQAAITRLEQMEQEHQNLSQTAAQGLENLSNQMTEMRAELTGILTLRSQELQPETDQELVIAEDATPPTVPNGGDGGDTPITANAPDASPSAPEAQAPQPRRIKRI